MKSSLVSVGDKLATIEEFMAGPGTYQWIDGYIRASILGVLQIDLAQRVISVKNIKGKPAYPKSGDNVLGVVDSLSDDVAFIDIFLVENRNVKSAKFTGVLHVSQVSDKYIKNLYEALGLGDIVRAKVLNSRSPFQLSTKTNQYGVVLAFCNKCGSVMKRRDSETLLCTSCGSIETRKISLKYVMK
ncbi:MAG: exosome complex RNA-binding protein Csl4 [Desulfurococcaceae archaeon]